MRIEGGRGIDRETRVSFSFDGQRIDGFAGDTVASALLAADVRLVGRSFKYHRPRGVMTAGSEEPNALVTVGSGSAQRPNIRATVQEIYDGLSVTSQNAWPSLRWDMLSVNDLAAPFIGAGFYYKTFMWPKAFWEQVYEPAIRRAAGLGGLSGRPSRVRREKAWAHCDLLVIGSGPAGLMAAVTAARGGADVILAEEDSAFGGRLLAERTEVAGTDGAAWAAATLAELRALPNVRIMPRTTVTGAYDGGVYGALERVGWHLGERSEALPVECFWRITAARVVLAAGALERPIAHPNNDRPGVMLASAVRAYLHRWGVAPGKRVVVFGGTDETLRTARDLIAAGVEVAALVDPRDGITCDGLRVIKGHVVGTAGRRALRSVTVQGEAGTERIAADCLALAGGWNPTLHLTCHMNGRPEWRADIASFVPRAGAVPGMEVAGAAAGDFSTAGALRGGVAAANAALEALGATAPPVDVPEAEDDPYRIAPIWSVPGKGRAWLDFQNDVTVKDVVQAASENMASVEHMKRYTTQGMAPDQGKSSNVAALAVLADATGRGIPETGTTTFRPPYVPVAIAAMGAGGADKGFAPERRTPSDGAARAKGAPMIEAGLWYRPSYFPKRGEVTWRQSCDREVDMVRQSVGVSDVTTLGKIDIQGPDAARFLDLVYANRFSTLKEGRVRYGLMLREDGHVMDDGTVARLGPAHFLVTTTTAAAGPVMRHLEFVHQCLVPGWKLRFASVTDHWAQFAVAGPRSRELLQGVLDAPLAEGEMPYMSCGPVAVGGVAGRLFRISFSGEHAYELALPMGYGPALWDLLVARAEALEGGPYGMEALNVLRIEKGFITHAEIDGRVTLDDLGMDRMMSRTKDCIGQAAAMRPGLRGEARQQMVGLQPAGAVKQLTAGGHLFLPEAEAVRTESIGHVTSACFSPTLQTSRALGFLENGRARHGEKVKVVDHMRDVETLVTVVDPVMFDADGGRLRG